MMKLFTACSAICLLFIGCGGETINFNQDRSNLLLLLINQYNSVQDLGTDLGTQVPDSSLDITEQGTIDDAIHNSGDVDWFKFTVSSSSIVVTTQRQSENTEDCQTVIALYESSVISSTSQDISTNSFDFLGRATNYCERDAGCVGSSFSLRVDGDIFSQLFCSTFDFRCEITAGQIYYLRVAPTSSATICRYSVLITQ